MNSFPKIAKLEAKRHYKLDKPFKMCRSESVRRTFNGTVKLLRDQGKLICLSVVTVCLFDNRRVYS